MQPALSPLLKKLIPFINMCKIAFYVGKIKRRDSAKLGWYTSVYEDKKVFCILSMSVSNCKVTYHPIISSDIHFSISSSAAQPVISSAAFILISIYHNILKVKIVVDFCKSNFSTSLKLILSSFK